MGAGLENVCAQNNKRELEKKREQLQREINETNKLLKLTEKNKHATQAELDALRKKINLRNDLINTINSEIRSLNGEIDKTGKSIDSLDRQMKQLRSDYATMVQFAQRNRNKYQNMMFLFAADDFNQAYKRLKYLQQFTENRRQQVEQINDVQNRLNSKKRELEVKKNEKTGLKVSQENQRKELETEKQQRDKLMTDLQASEKSLRKKLENKIRDKEKLDKAIAALVRKEIEAAKKKATNEGKKNVTSENVFTLTPEARELSNSFSSNKGNLPWPVEKGRISETFGEHQHPLLKNVTTKNDGIDIRTGKASPVRSIFNGEVTGTVNLPNGSAVIVRHGEYLSVYSNLEEVYVKKGDKVTTRQHIGVVKTDSESGYADLNLQIWKGFVKLNPEPWLAKK
jgi:septal ring factor EnvC (AmiA/AmiB activator)